MKHSIIPVLSRILVQLIAFSVLPVPAEETLTELVKKIRPSVVLISTYDSDGEPLGRGSGFFANKKGDVVTNRHVLQKASSAEVKTNAGKVYPIKGVIAEDLEADLIQVTLQVPQEEVFPISLSESIPEVGEKVVVIGNPLGLENTVSDGIVSAVREIPGYGDVIQMTAPMSPGSSGSPVVNLKGEVLGVATFQMSDGQNLNFVIPAKRIKIKKWEKEKTFQEWHGGIAADWLDSAEGLYYRGLILYFGDKYQEALPFFEKAVQKKLDYAEAHFNIGYCKDNLGRYAEAIESYRQAIRIAPDVASAHCNLGVTYGKLGRYAEAIESFKQAIHINPDNASAHYNLGKAYAQLGRHEEAIESFKQAIRIKPDYADAYFNLGMAQDDLGRYTEAIDGYREAIRINADDAEAYYNLGVICGKLSRYADAIESYKQAIRINPDYAEAHYNLGVNYGKLSRYAEAIGAYEQVVRIKPDDAVVHSNLGAAYFMLDRYVESVEAYRQAIRIKPGDPATYTLLGTAYAELGRYAEAVVAFKKAIRINPDDADTHFLMGSAYMSLGNTDSAFEEYRNLEGLDIGKAYELLDFMREKTLEMSEDEHERFQVMWEKSKEERKWLQTPQVVEPGGVLEEILEIRKEQEEILQAPQPSVPGGVLEEMRKIAEPMGVKEGWEKKDWTEWIPIIGSFVSAEKAEQIETGLAGRTKEKKKFWVPVGWGAPGAYATVPSRPANEQELEAAKKYLEDRYRQMAFGTSWEWQAIEGIIDTIPEMIEFLMAKKTSQWGWRSVQRHLPKMIIGKDGRLEIEFNSKKP